MPRLFLTKRRPPFIYMLGNINLFTILYQDEQNIENHLNDQLLQITTCVMGYLKLTIADRLLKFMGYVKLTIADRLLKINRLRKINNRQ